MSEIHNQIYVHNVLKEFCDFRENRLSEDRAFLTGGFKITFTREQYETRGIFRVKHASVRSVCATSQSASLPVLFLKQDKWADMHFDKG
jgi:hypothetical protein